MGFAAQVVDGDVFNSTGEGRVLIMKLSILIGVIAF